MKTEEHPSAQLSPEDGKVVDLVAAALVDPDLHTATRMRLHDQLLELVRATHHEVYGASGAEKHEQQLAAHEHHVPRVVESTLVDPDLPTERRMRLRREITELLNARHPEDPA